MKIVNNLVQGLSNYENIDTQQRLLHVQVRAEKIPSCLVLSQFHPTYTAGRATKAEHILNPSLKVITTDRAGSITWHGPGQLVVYPIVKLRNPQDTITYIRAVEAGVLQYLRQEFSLPVSTIAGRAGIWIENPAPARKICAIGLKISQGATLHGLALNINPDFSKAFQGIIPCGLDDAWVCSLADMGIYPPIEEVAEKLCKYLIQELNPLIVPVTAPLSSPAHSTF